MMRGRGRRTVVAVIAAAIALAALTELIGVAATASAAPPACRTPVGSTAETDVIG